jgi:magnesium transporter
MSEAPEKDTDEEFDTVEDALQEAVAASDEDKVRELVSALPTYEALRQATLMEPEEREQLLGLLAPEEIAELLDEAPALLAANIVSELETDVAARAMENLQTSVQADIVQELGEQSAESLLLEMAPKDAEELRRLTQYDPNSAGGLMETDVFRFSRSDTVGTLLKEVVEGDDQFERHRGQHPYILDDDGRLIGVVSLRNLLRARRATPLREIMTEAISVSPEIHQDELVDLFEEHPFLSIPVVDQYGVLLGAVSREDIAEAERERIEHDSMSMHRVGDELRSMPTLTRARRRLAWLSSNIVLNIIAASVISAYEETLAAMIAIAVFLPMVSDMSGCSGNQAVAVSMRELSLGLARPVDLIHVLRKEISIGVINGIVLGILIGIVAWVWKDNAVLGLVIGLALSLNTVLSVSIGGTVPLLLKRFGVDPAVASGPLLTTVTDMAGFFLVLSLATLFMAQMAA